MRLHDELVTVHEAFTDALTKGDIDALTALYSDDARVLVAGAPMVHGRRKIASLLRAIVGSGSPSIRFETVQVLEDGMLVVDIGHYVETRRPDGPLPTEHRGAYVMVYRRQEDKSLKAVVDAVIADHSPTS